MPPPIRYTILRSGYCTGAESAAIPGTSRGKMQFPALCVLLEHPEHGLILYDTGYHTRLYEVARRHWASRLYMRLIPVFITPQDHVAAQLPSLGWQPEEVRHLILSHFHPDHIPGVADFPAARLHYLPEARKVLDRAGFRAIRKGYFPGLLPDDLADRTAPSPEPTPNPPPLDIFQPGVDLFGDGSLRGIPLPGHAAGQMGLSFTDPEGRLTLLCSDACWFTRSLRERIMPSRIADWILESKPLFRETFDRLCDLYQNHPEVRIIPAHCPEVWEEARAPLDRA